MAKPMEIIHQNMQEKLSSVESMLKIYDDPSMGEIKATYQTIALRYVEFSISPLCRYYRAKTPREQCDAVDNFCMIIVRENLVADLDACVDLIRDAIETAKKERFKFQVLENVYKKYIVGQRVKHQDNTQCPECGSTTFIFPAKSEIRCDKCSYSMQLAGTVFDESQFYNQDNANIRRENYKTSRHCKYHLDCLLGIKNPGVPQRVWDKINKWIKSNNIIYLKRLHCADFRRCLKAIKETKYNKDVPYIRLMVTGVRPERLYYAEKVKICQYFDKGASAYEQLIGAGTNLRYYPHQLAKIIDMVLCEPSDRRRKLAIISCIHFQRDSTVVNNDKIWKDVCDLVPEFVFKKTDKDLLIE